MYILQPMKNVIGKTIGCRKDNHRFRCFLGAEVKSISRRHPFTVIAVIITRLDPNSNLALKKTANTETFM